MTSNGDRQRPEGTTCGGSERGRNTCASIRSVLSAGKKDGRRPRRLSTISSRTAAIKNYFGIKRTGRHCARRITTLKQAKENKFSAVGMGCQFFPTLKTQDRCALSRASSRNSKGGPAMETKLLPVSGLKPAPYNPRKALKPGDKAYEKLFQSTHPARGATVSFKP